MILWHGSPELALSSIKEEIGIFGGIFASPNKETAEAHGKYLYRIELSEETVLLQHDLDYTLADADIAEALETSMRITSSEQLNLAWTAVVQDEEADLSDEESMALFRQDTRGEASWRAQYVRGKMARKLGYSAVEMQDEHGTTFLVLKGRLARVD